MIMVVLIRESTRIYRIWCLRYFSFVDRDWHIVESLHFNKLGFTRFFLIIRFLWLAEVLFQICFFSQCLSKTFAFCIFSMIWTSMRALEFWWKVSICLWVSIFFMGYLYYDMIWNSFLWMKAKSMVSRNFQNFMIVLNSLSLTYLLVVLEFLRNSFLLCDWDVHICW